MTSAETSTAYQQSIAKLGRQDRVPGARHALLFRTTLALSLAMALACSPNGERYRTFGGQLEERVKRRLAVRPGSRSTLRE